MSSKTLKVLIVGAGLMGEVHSKNYNNITDVEIVGIVDKNTAKAGALAEKYGCRYFEELTDGFVCRPDFVDICLPTRFHKESIIESFKAGMDVICEKPISLSVQEACDIVDASKEYGRKFMVAHVVRFWPEYAKLSDMINKNEFNNIKCATFFRYGPSPNWSEGNWMLSDKKSGGIIYDVAIHDFDFVISLFGMPDWVFAKKSMMGEDYTAYVNVILGYKDVNVMIESGFITAVSYPFTTGFRLNNGEVTLEYENKSGKGLLMYSAEPGVKKLEYPDYDPYKAELNYFMDCIRNDMKPAVGSGEDAIKAVLLASLIEESAKNNKKIEVIFDGPASYQRG